MQSVEDFLVPRVALSSSSSRHGDCQLNSTLATSSDTSSLCSSRSAIPPSSDGGECDCDQNQDDKRSKTMIDTLTADYSILKFSVDTICIKPVWTMFGLELQL